MNFQQSVINNLPEGHKFVKIFPKSLTQSVVETNFNGFPAYGLLEKVNPSSLFINVPSLVVPPERSYNDVYAALSKRYNLGWVKGVDYFNNTLIDFDGTTKYVVLPISPYSPGYYGEVGVYVIPGDGSLAGDIQQRDLTQLDQVEHNKELRLRTTLTSTIFSLKDGTEMFEGDKLSSLFASYIWHTLINEFQSAIVPITSDDLLQGVVTQLFNDGVSDVFILTIPSGNSFSIRFSSEIGDIPMLLKETDDENILDEGSQELLPWRDDKESEKPGEEGEGNITGKEELTNVNDILIQSLSPEESIPEEKQEEIKPVSTRKRKSK